MGSLLFQTQPIQFGLVCTVVGLVESLALFKQALTSNCVAQLLSWRPELQDISATYLDFSMLSSPAL